MLLVCLCCCFSGFGSVKVFAAEVSPDALNNFYLFPFNNISIGDNSAVGQFNSVSGVYTASGNLGSGNYITFSDNLSGGVFPSVVAGNDYLLYLTLTAPADFDYNRILLRKEFDDSASTYTLYPNNLGSFITYSDVFVNGTTTISGILQFTSNKTIAFNTGSSILVQLDSSVAINGRLDWAFYLLDITNNTEEQINSIITAINNQTGALQGSIGQAADDLQQSIEDQYQMQDEEDFGFSDIQQQYEEKMGVLTFGTETTIQMLELFSPSNAGEAYIRVPGWSMDVQGETYQIWDEYVFYFDSIEENFPFLVTTMRTFTVAMFYVSIVGYITKVYERNFLAK